LIHHGAKVKDKIQIPPICWAAETGLVEVFDFLIKHKIKENEIPPICWAAEKGYVAMVDFLIKQNKSLMEEADTNDATPLLYATFAKHISVIKLLIQKGANLQKQMCCGKTALMIAASQDDVKIVKLLIKANPKTTIQTDTNFNGVLDHAVMREKKSVLRYFLTLKLPQYLNPKMIERAIAKTKIKNIQNILKQINENNRYENKLQNAKYQFTKKFFICVMFYVSSLFLILTAENSTDKEQNCISLIFFSAPTLLIIFDFTATQLKFFFDFFFDSLAIRMVTYY
jgi:hypothetical protein